MDKARKAAILHKAFDAGVVLKGIDGVLEVMGGILFIFVNPSGLGKVVRFLTAHELSEDPRDLVANFLVRTVHHLSPASESFGSVYLLSHGFIKVVLVVSLLKSRLWAYPAAIIFFSLFIAYQVYRYTYSHSFWLIILSIIDFAVIWLTWWEYQRLKKGIDVH
jgi:uncharacterized membrane protein